MRAIPSEIYPRVCFDESSFALIDLDYFLKTIMSYNTTITISIIIVGGVPTHIYPNPSLLAVLPAALPFILLTK